MSIVKYSHKDYSFEGAKDRVLWLDDFKGDQLKDEWDLSGTGTPTAVLQAESLNGVLRLGTSASASDNAQLWYGGLNVIWRTQNPHYETGARAVQVDAGTFIWLGLWAGSSNRVNFRWQGSGNWIAECRQATLPQVDTGIAGDTEWHVFRIELNSTDLEIYYFIDGVKVAEITTEFPNGPYEPLQQVSTLAAASKYLDLDYVGIEWER